MSLGQGCSEGTKGARRQRNPWVDPEFSLPVLMPILSKTAKVIQVGFSSWVVVCQPPF